MPLRKTPPVEKQVIDVDFSRKSNALFQKRLIDFDTGSFLLEEQHKDWLRRSLAHAKTQQNFHLRMYGYASKLGKSSNNHKLAQDRLNAVLAFCQTIDTRSRSFIEIWENNGEDDSSGNEKDDSAVWRAVEVHIFIGQIPEPVVGNKDTPIKIPQARLPGGDRFSDWLIASPGGFFAAYYIGGGFNVFEIRNIRSGIPPRPGETRTFIQPVVGVGWSLGLSGLGKVWNIVQQIFTGVQVGTWDFTQVVSSLPVTWEEVSASLVTISSLSGGVLNEAGCVASVQFNTNVYHYGASGVPIKTDEKIFDFATSGQTWQVGANASRVYGPLIEISRSSPPPDLPRWPPTDPNGS